MLVSASTFVSALLDTTRSQCLLYRSNAMKRSGRQVYKMLCAEAIHSPKKSVYSSCCRHPSQNGSPLCRPSLDDKGGKKTSPVLVSASRPVHAHHSAPTRVGTAWATVEAKWQNFVQSNLCMLITLMSICVGTAWTTEEVRRQNRMSRSWWRWISLARVPPGPLLPRTLASTSS